MRPIIPSTALTLVSAASTIKAAPGIDRIQNALTLPLPDQVDTSYASTGNEFAPSTASNKSAVSLKKKKSSDLGVLARSSCRGGRCHDKPDILSRASQNRRHLEFFCPKIPVCTEFCACQQSSTFHGCAAEINSICISGDIPNCLNADYTAFYETFYCNLASCYLDDGRETEDCICAYHQGYCDLYSVEGTLVEASSCAIADCCDQGTTTDEKRRCITGETPQPGKNPVEAGGPITQPTSRPNKSFPSTPTISATSEPMILSAGRSPSANPTASTKKKSTSAPTQGPTRSPSKESTSSPIASPLDSRCGDLTCKSQENPANCESDCIVTSFKTPSSSNANSRGVLFTVNAISDLTIFSFDVFGKKDGHGRCVIYTRAGGYQGYENDDEGWELISNKDVAMKRDGRKNLGTLRREVTTLAGSSQAFYIWCETGILYTEPTEVTSEGDPVVSDGLLVLKEGMATEKLFEKGADGAEFNGWIRYYSSSLDGPV